MEGETGFMSRKISAWILIVLSGLFLVLSLTGMVAAWVYNTPLTDRVLSELNAIDDELSAAQSTLKSTHAELERALRLVDTAQSAVENLAQQSTDAENLFEGIQKSLDDELLPELRTTRERLETAREALENLQSILTSISSFLPIADLSAPDQILTDLISSARSLDSEIANVEDVAEQASIFVSDTSYLLGGDLTETRESLQSFLGAVEKYQAKIAAWRSQVADLIEQTPGWIDKASVSITIFLLWFGLSQFGLLLHGLSILRGENPLDILRRR